MPIVWQTATVINLENRNTFHEKFVDTLVQLCVNLVQYVDTFKYHHN